MAYNCRLYINNGFNDEDRPDEPALLESLQYIDVDPLQILQDAELTEIDIRITWDRVNNASYCKIGSWYYVILNISMLDYDVAHITLRPAYVLSAGGISAIDIVSGITERVHIAKSDDTFGKCAEYDPLMTPANSLDLDVKYKDLTVGEGYTSFTIAETTIDLALTANNTTSISYTDGSGETVTVPTFVPITQTTKYEYGGAHGTLAYVVGAVDGNGNETLQYSLTQGIARARELGVENAIVSQYRLPRYFAGPLNPGSQTELRAGTKTISTDNIAFVQYQNAQNMRLNYGDFTKYGLLTMGGNRVEYKAEEIAPTTPPVAGDAPTIKVKADLRSDGCPYYRYEYFNGDNSNDSFFLNAVAGAPWEIVPLRYTEKSGSVLDRQVYDTANANKFTEFRNEHAMDFIKDLKENLKRETGYMNILGLQVYNRYYHAAKTVTGAAKKGLETWLDLQKYKRNAETENIAFLAGQVSAPELSFPYNSAIMRDAMGNGVIEYRYKYSPVDVARIDRLLTMYGYRYTKALEKTDFTNRSKFNYVKANGVCVGGNIPQWWADGIAAELSEGVRYWHVLPDTSIYNTGQN